MTCVVNMLSLETDFVILFSHFPYNNREESEKLKF